jgi:hypothetical protein
MTTFAIRPKTTDQTQKPAYPIRGTDRNPLKLKNTGPNATSSAAC